MEHIQSTPKDYRVIELQERLASELAKESAIHSKDQNVQRVVGELGVLRQRRSSAVDCERRVGAVCERASHPGVRAVEKRVLQSLLSAPPTTTA